MQTDGVRGPEDEATLSPAANASTEAARGGNEDTRRLEVSLASAMLAVTQRVTEIDGRASARAQGAELAARAALEEARRQVSSNPSAFV